MFTPEAQRHKENQEDKSSLRPLRLTVTWVQDCWNGPTRNVCVTNGIDFRKFNVSLLSKSITRSVL
jgi:hypothetical protein